MAKLSGHAATRPSPGTAHTGGQVMANFILVSQEQEDFYVNVDQVRALLQRSRGDGTTIVFDQDHSVTVDDDADPL